MPGIITSRNSSALHQAFPAPEGGLDGDGGVHVDGGRADEFRGHRVVVDHQHHHLLGDPERARELLQRLAVGGLGLTASAFPRVHRRERDAETAGQSLLGVAVGGADPGDEVGRGQHARMIERFMNPQR
jgi:hypothetical protein